MFRIALATVAVVGAVSAASSQAPPPDAAENGRYSFSRVDTGFLRLDMRTGQISLCTDRAAAWSCRTTADDRAALDAEIARLQAENVVLKKALMDRNLPLPEGVKPPSPEARAESKISEGGLNLPNSADMDRVMSFVDKTWKRLVEMMANLQRDLTKKT